MKVKNILNGFTCLPARLIGVCLYLLAAQCANADIVPQVENNEGFIKWDTYRLYFDNRKTPSSTSSSKPYQNALEIYNETKECDPTKSFADCDSTSGIKIFLNAPNPQVANARSSDPAIAAALRPNNTHASGIYITSYGREATVTPDPKSSPITLIAQSGIHLEPHGSHQGLRIDGTNNSGTDLRIDLSQGSTGIAVYGSPDTKGTYCDYLKLNCERTVAMRLTNGIMELQNIQIARSITRQDTMSYALANQALGVEVFTHWHTTGSNDMTPIHCVYNSTVTADSIIKLNAYKRASSMKGAHSYAVKDVWGPKQIPSDCKGPQLIKTDSAGTYSNGAPSDDLTLTGGFSVYILGSSAAPLDPGAWSQQDRPSFIYEIIQPLTQ